MPIYEYACTHCQYEHEALQSMSDAPLTTCPSCGRETLQKRVSAAGFRLKGGGWYETDFKSGNQRNVVNDGKSTSASSSGDKGGSAKSTAGSESGSSGDSSSRSSSAKSSGASSGGGQSTSSSSKSSGSKA